MQDSIATVVENRDLGNGVWLLRLKDPSVVAHLAPGCFVMVACGPELAPVLRRPFSVQRSIGDTYDILYRDVGVGTHLMTGMLAGQEVRVLGPMGNSFSMPDPGVQAVLLGGGVGIPPMVALADALRDSGHTQWEAYLGVRAAGDAGCWVGFDEGYGPGSGLDSQVHRATMDGSVGFHGHVVAAWKDRWEREGPPPGGRAVVYACGPMVMLRAVAAASEELGLPCEVSVETMMGCGMGACMSCVIESADARDPEKRATMSPYDRWLLACCKGPVFPAGRVVLEEGEFLH
ncbi:MAG: dihydroorotate dehydrogenase electron transfer subunit [Myxococcota bacterium]|nr:dihydroorotate dehydrogenase electron transfer subunit [Myxococcota bacterium]